MNSIAFVDHIKHQNKAYKGNCNETNLKPTETNLKPTETNLKPTEPKGGEKVEKKTVISFTLEKATKNTMRYTEKTESAPIIGTLYVQKWYLSNPAPKELKVTIEEG